MMKILVMGTGDEVDRALFHHPHSSLFFITIIHHHLLRERPRRLGGSLVSVNRESRLDLLGALSVMAVHVQIRFSPRLRGSIIALVFLGDLGGLGGSKDGDP
jgi:hypothetical protein